MVSFYNLIDLALLVGVLVLFKKSYEKKSYLKFFEYFKVFTIVTVSAAFASDTGAVLQKFYITKVDTYATLILISFVVNGAILYIGWRYLLKFSNKFVNNAQFRAVASKILTFFEVVVLLTFAIYMVMQLYISKKYLYTSLHKTYSYPKIERFYKRFLNDDFVNMILNSDTGIDRKEVLLKSLRDSI